MNDPCDPSPCGPNSQCRVNEKQAVCSCRTGYIGSPPSCRPECVTSSECPTNRACINQKCQDPCPSSCGVNANCRVVNHSPICSCKNTYTGDPFTGCFFVEGTSTSNPKQLLVSFSLFFHPRVSFLVSQPFQPFHHRCLVTPAALRPAAPILYAAQSATLRLALAHLIISAAHQTVVPSVPSMPNVRAIAPACENVALILVQDLAALKHFARS